jgi:hypothetical protein
MADSTLRIVTAVFVQTALRQAKLARRSLSGLLAYVPRSHIEQRHHFEFYRDNSFQYILLVLEQYLKVGNAQFAQ